MGSDANSLEKAEKVTRRRSDDTADMGGYLARYLTIVEYSKEKIGKLDMKLYKTGERRDSKVLY